MASIKDIARLAGVSVSTVSRVLTDNPLVGRATRARVEQAIATTGYRPNLLARGLRSRSGSVIGLVVPEIVREPFSTFVEHTGRFCTDHGFGLMVASTGGSPEVEAAFIDDLLRRHVDGIIFSRVSDRSHVLDFVERSNTTVVVLDRSLERENIPTVVLDNRRAGAIAAEHLVALGHRAIGVVTGPQDIALCRERQRGFAAVLRRRGLEAPPSQVLEGDFRLEGGRAAAYALVERGLPVTALWCHNDLMALGAMRAFSRSGVRIPEDLSIVGMDDTTLCELSDPALTTVTQPFKEMCRLAVELIADIHSGRQVRERRAVLTPGIVVRASSGPPPRMPRDRPAAAGDRGGPRPDAVLPEGAERNRR